MIWPTLTNPYAFSVLFQLPLTRKSPYTISLPLLFRPFKQSQTDYLRGLILTATTRDLKQCVINLWNWPVLLVFLLTSFHYDIYQWAKMIKDCTHSAIFQLDLYLQLSCFLCFLSTLNCLNHDIYPISYSLSHWASRLPFLRPPQWVLGACMFQLQFSGTVDWIDSGSPLLARAILKPHR